MASISIDARQLCFDGGRVVIAQPARSAAGSAKA
jgi:hypothetical protein